MKRAKRIFSLFLILFSLTLVACDDPYDRIQGEPGEDGTQDASLSRASEDHSSDSDTSEEPETEH